MKNNELVTKWVIDTVKEQYADDIALVVSHTTLRLNEAEKTISYFVPITEKGRMFGQTFILDGEGFDIWGIDWNRLEKFANLEEYNITVLADSEILYARNAVDAQRFQELKDIQSDNLKNNIKMRECALTAYAQAKNIYFEMFFSKNNSDIKLGAGYVLDYLAQSIAFTNHKYFKKSHTDQINELKTMQKLPSRFTELYYNVIKEHSGERQKTLCYELLTIVQLFLDENKLLDDKNEVCNENNYQDLADWYAELSYTWLRIRKYSENNDVIKTYMWGILLQEELNHVCADFGLNRFDLMASFNSDNLNVFATHANAIEMQVRNIIKNGGGIIREYSTFENFINEV